MFVHVSLCENINYIAGDIICFKQLLLYYTINLNTFVVEVESVHIRKTWTQTTLVSKRGYFSSSVQQHKNKTEMMFG